jgi:phosphatidylserine decarboxylase
MRLHREGNLILLLTALLSVGIVAGAWWAWGDTPLVWLAGLVTLVVLVFGALVVNFFRHPERPWTLDPQAIVAPCDGKVVVIEDVVEPRYFQQPMRQISIFMSPLNVHVNRNPIGGEVKHVQYYPGKFLVAWHPKSSELNEQTFIVVEQEPGGLTIGYKQIAGGLARRLKWYVKPGQRVAQSQEMGFIKFGSRMDVIMPLDMAVDVQLGQVVKGGITVIARKSS